MAAPILVATDFSARADRAIDRGLMLGEQWRSPVVLVHALTQKEAEAADRAAWDAKMRSVLPENGEGVEQVEFHLIEGTPPQAIAETADQFSAKVIVMGPARYNSLEDYFLGTAVDHALRHCEQPVLIVKERPHRPYDRIVVASDFSACSASSLLLALDWYPDAAIHLAHGCHVPFDAWQKDQRVKDDLIAEEQRRTADFVEGLKLPAEQKRRIATHVAQGSAHKIVKQVVQEVGANLVVIGSHGESGFRHATIGSMANALLETTPVDTLMVTTRS